LPAWQKGLPVMGEFRKIIRQGKMLVFLQNNGPAKIYSLR